MSHLDERGKANVRWMNSWSPGSVWSAKIMTRPSPKNVKCHLRFTHAPVWNYTQKFSCSRHWGTTGLKVHLKKKNCYSLRLKCIIAEKNIYTSYWTLTEQQILCENKSFKLFILARWAFYPTHGVKGTPACWKRPTVLIRILKLKYFLYIFYNV